MYRQHFGGSNGIIPTRYIYYKNLLELKKINILKIQI